VEAPELQWNESENKGIALEFALRSVRHCWNCSIRSEANVCRNIALASCLDFQHGKGSSFTLVLICLIFAHYELIIKIVLPGNVKKYVPPPSTIKTI
jgi:hypothetical protein